jgi:hypothetical protein
MLRDGSVDVEFLFRCYPDHYSSQESRFKYVLSIQSSVCLLVSRIIAELYGDSGVIASHEIPSIFDLRPHAVWKVTVIQPPVDEVHMDDADTQDGGTSIDASCILLVVSSRTDPSQGLAIETAAPIESPRSIPCTPLDPHHIPNSATPAAEAQETSRLANRTRIQTPERVTPPISPRRSSLGHIPLVAEQGQEEEEEHESPTPTRTAPTNPVPVPNDAAVTVLHAVNPENGPTSGGTRISLYVSNLDPGTRVYPRFGRNVGRVAVRCLESYLSNELTRKDSSTAVTISRGRCFVICLRPHNLARSR